MTGYQEFFQAFGYSEKDTLYLRRFHDKDKSKSPCNMSCNFSQIDALAKSMVKYNNDEYGIFFIVNGGGQSDKDVKRARAQFIDMDDFSIEEQWKRVNAFQLEPSIIIKTRKSLHCYWLLDDGDIKLFRDIQERLIQHFSSDSTVKNESRVMRLYGFYHQKEEPVMVELVKFQPQIRYTQRQLLEVLPEVKRAKETQEKAWSDISGEITKHRHDFLISTIGSLKVKGLSDEAVKQAVIAENKLKCKPPLDDVDLEKTIFPAIKRYPNDKTYCKPVCDDGKARPVKKADFHLDKAANVEIKEPEWLVPGYIPKYGITTIAGEGGVGKTSIWCSLVACLTTGKQSFLARDGNPFENNPQNVVVFSAEDSWNYVLKQRLINNGADMDRILYMGPEDERFTDLNFNGDLLRGIIEANKPDVVVYDPVQAFVPANLRMGDRNAMRKCFSPLIGFGETYKTTSIVIAHANKQSGVWGRKRIADSSDIWDASRSVLMAGIVPNNDGLRYISHEKSNWGKLQDTALFELDDGVPTFRNYSSKKDREFILEDSKIKNASPALEGAKDFILDTLREHKQMEVAELNELAKAEGISANALKDAKAALRKEGTIHTWSLGNRKDDKKYFVTLKDTEKTNE